MKKEINSLIDEYAKVYQKFEDFQHGKSLLASGDQKTGVIAEYYAKLYIESTYNVKAEYAKSGASYDISYVLSGKLVKVQVKGVSEHSKSRRVAPLNLRDSKNDRAFDELYLVALGKNFLPTAFYVNTFDSIWKRLNNERRTRVVGSIMRDTNAGGTRGSAVYDFNYNKIDELIKLVS